MKKRHRNEPSTAIELQQADDDARDDLNTKESFLSDEYNYELDCDNAYHDNEHHDSVLCDEDDDDDTASTGEGDMDCSASISLGSLGESSSLLIGSCFAALYTALLMILSISFYFQLETI